MMKLPAPRMGRGRGASDMVLFHGMAQRAPGNGALPPRLFCQGAHARPPTPPAPGASPLDPKPEASAVPPQICYLVSSSGLSPGRARWLSPAGCALHVPACRRSAFRNPMCGGRGTTDAHTPPRPEICRQPRRMALPDNESGTPPASSTQRAVGSGSGQRPRRGSCQGRAAAPDGRRQQPTTRFPHATPTGQPYACPRGMRWPPTARVGR